MRKLAVFLGTPVDDVTMAEAVDRIYELVDLGRATRRVHQVATVNVDFVVRAMDDPQLAGILQAADLAIPDGMPLVWLSRLLGTPLRERVAGADLVPALADRGAARRARLLFFGAAPGVADRAAAVLREASPGIDVVASAAPVVQPDGSMPADALRPLRDADPDIVCVALGNPKQEYWIHRYAEAIGAPVFIGVGGTLDLLVGAKRRAPAWAQRLGLEWIVRTLQDPQRLARRYANDIVRFFPPIARQIWIGRPARRRQGTATFEHDVLRLSGRPRREDVLLPHAVGNHLVVDVGGLDPPDNPAAAVLASLALTCSGSGLEVEFRGATAAYCRALQRLRLDWILPAAASRRAATSR